MRHPVTDVALLAYIAKRKLNVVSYTEATKACKSSSSASRALHQLIHEGLLNPQPKLIGLRYVTQYVVTDKGKKVSELALQLQQLREVSKAAREKEKEFEETSEEVISASEEGDSEKVQQQQQQQPKPAAVVEPQIQRGKGKKPTAVPKKKLAAEKKNKPR